jgi:hypothetical protein
LRLMMAPALWAASTATARARFCSAFVIVRGR